MNKSLVLIFTVVIVLSFAVTGYSEEDMTNKVLKSGLVGAGTGALAAGMTGGKAGKGALIGAGTSVIGSVLLDAITGTPSQRVDEDYEYESREEIDDYYEVPKEDGTKKVLKQGIVGAGTGAIAAGVSGGKAGTGALIGAGTGVIGNALLDSITTPPKKRRGRAYRRRKRPKEVVKYKVIKRYDPEGNLIAEEYIPIDEDDL